MGTIKEIIRESLLKIVNESSLNRILSQHFKNGFIIISSYRGERTDDENKKLFDELKQIVKQNKYSFIPVWGGYIENKGTEQEIEIKEPALIIPNYEIGSKKSYDTSENLKNLGIKLSNKFSQESFLYKPKSNDNKSFYINSEGKITDSFENISVNDLTKIYFTKLHNSKNKVDRRFTFTNETIYINEPPKSVSEAMNRYGEDFYNI